MKARDVRVSADISSKIASAFKRLAAVSLDDAIRVFEIAFNSRTQNVRNQRVRHANATSTGLVFISRTDAAKRRADFFVAETFFAGVIQGAMIGKNQMRARTDLYPFRRDLDALVISRSASSKNALGSMTMPLPSTQVLPSMNDA